MKKILVVAVLAIFALQQANAQEFNFGAKGGINFANVTGGDTKTLTSFHLGLVAEYMVNDQFTIQPELLYSAQGTKFDDWKTKLNYITLPVMAKYYIAKGFNIQAGPQIGFLISAKDNEKDIKDACKKLDFGLNFGLGYKLDNNIFFDARYNVGLTKIADNGGKSKNGVFQISVGYMF